MQTDRESRRQSRNCSINEYVMKNGKKLRRGLTTGTCAAAAASAAAWDLLTGEVRKEVMLKLPDGQSVLLPVRKLQCAFGAEYAVTKDSGDDPDVTNGTEIRARAEFCYDAPENSFREEEFPGVCLQAGEGVGIVTKRGLEQNVGMPAINRIPRKMILSAACEALENSDREEEICITVSVPEGRKLARRTFNPMLGVEGGISILGTTGIIEPMSEKAIVDTIALQIRQKKEEGRTVLVLVPGNYGKRYAEQDLGLSSSAVVPCSNYIGESLDLAVASGFKKILLIGNLGKLIKVAAGIMNTHSRVSDARWEIMAAYAGIHGADASILRQIRECATTDAMLELLTEWKIRETVMEDLIRSLGQQLTRRTGDHAVCGSVVFSEQYGCLGQTAEAGKILDEMQKEQRREQEW